MFAGIQDGRGGLNGGDATLSAGTTTTDTNADVDSKRLLQEPVDQNWHALVATKVLP